MNNLSNYKEKALLILFVAIVAFFFLDNKLHILPTIKSAENRRLAAKPIFDVHLLDPYPAKYESWFNDTFNTRVAFFQLFTSLNIHGFMKSPLPQKAIIGKDGEFFITDNEIKVYRGTNLFSAERVEQIGSKLSNWQKELEKRGVKMYVAFAPVKASIYGDYMPANITKVNTTNYPMQLKEYILNHTKIKFIDLYKPLKENRDLGRLYYKTDNHWNMLSGLIVTKEIIKTLRVDFPKIPAFEWNDYSYHIIPRKIGAMAGIFAMPIDSSDTDYSVARINGEVSFEGKKFGYKPVKGFPYPWEYEMVRETNNKKLLKILIIRDSFAHHIFPFISNYFSKTVMIFDAWQYNVNFEIIEQEKPDIVLIMPLECHIVNM